MDDTMKFIIDCINKDIDFYKGQIDWDNKMIALYKESLKKDFYSRSEKYDIMRKLAKLNKERKENKERLAHYCNRLYENVCYTLKMKGGN